MTGLARVVGLVVGYAGVSLALRMADSVDALCVEAARQAAAQAAAELDADAEGSEPA